MNHRSEPAPDPSALRSLCWFAQMRTSLQARAVSYGCAAALHWPVVVETLRACAGWCVSLSVRMGLEQAAVWG